MSRLLAPTVNSLSNSALSTRPFDGRPFVVSQGVPMVALTGLVRFGEREDADGWTDEARGDCCDIGAAAGAMQHYRRCWRR